jgi:septal ring factor EnvC (AmiA/AmiB activator)
MARQDNTARFCWLLLAGLLLVLPAQAQRVQQVSDRTSTEQRLRDLRDQITQAERKLSETTQAETATMETLRSMDRELAIRGELTSSYEDRLDELALASDSLRDAMAQFEVDLGEMKEQYQHHAIHAYKYGRLHDLALILSASSINQMLIRVRYLNRFADQRRTKLQAIEAAAKAMEDRRAKLVEARVQTQLLLQEAQKEQRKMQNLQQSRKGVIKELQSQKTSIQGDIAQKRKAASDLENRIRSMIAAETARRRERITSDPAEDVIFTNLTGSFTQNKGKLPWPSTGAVVEPFGDIVNPVHGTKTPNPGILIATKPQAEVRAIFDGVVLGVSVLPEFGTYVAIQHGEYQSVYSNFSMVYIAEGAQVKAGQVIGRAGTDAEPKQSGIFFALFKNGAPFDPATWLMRR